MNRTPYKLSFLSILILLFSGCVLSPGSVVSPAEATYDPRLLGTWVNEENRAVIKQSIEETYSVEYTNEDGKTGRFEGRLGKLGEHLVFDVRPAPHEVDIPEPYDGVMLPGHLLLILNWKGEEIETRLIEPEPLLAAIRAGEVRVAHERTGDGLVLLGGTKELRAALGKYIARPKALGEPTIWRRADEKSVAKAAGVEVPCFEVSAWREADILFRRDPNWIGGDAASTVDLGGGRTLWLFGDTWIDPSGKGTRNGARMVSNSLAIQTGSDPATAAIKFFWGKAPDGSPTAFLPDRGKERLWFGNGVRVDDRLILFANRIISTNTGIGFESVGWAAVMIDNPDAEPTQWNIRPLETRPNHLGIIVGFAAVMQRDGYVYAFGSQDPVKSHPIYAARWPVAEVRKGNLLQPEWWAGERLGWVPDSSTEPRWPLFENGQSELTIHFDEAAQRFLTVQTQGIFGPGDVAMRAAPALTGPWTAPRMLYRPPEFYRPNVLIYSAKAHPHLTGADLAITYATNTTQFAEHLTDNNIYYPRFVKLTRCK